jgi:hypothetical protein
MEAVWTPETLVFCHNAEDLDWETQFIKLKQNYVVLCNIIAILFASFAVKCFPSRGSRIATDCMQYYREHGVERFVMTHFGCHFYFNVHRQIAIIWVSTKVKLSLCFFFKRAPRHQGVLGEWRYSSTHSLTSSLDGGGIWIALWCSARLRAG